MRRLGAFLSAALLGLTGCFNIDVVAPPGADITLMASKQPTKVRREYRTWFVVWGMVPLDNRMPELVLAHEKLTDARGPELARRWLEGVGAPDTHFNRGR